MHKIAFMSALTLALAVSGAAFAQSTTGATNSATPAAAKPQQAAQQPAFTIETLTQDLQKAGFTDVQVLPELLLGSGQNQGRQSGIDDYRPTWHERYGSVDAEDPGTRKGS